MQANFLFIKKKTKICLYMCKHGRQLTQNAFFNQLLMQLWFKALTQEGQVWIFNFTTTHYFDGLLH